MHFDAAEIDQTCFQMRDAEFRRSSNRSRIDKLFNGAPPYTPEDVQKNNIAININDLSSTRLAHDARAQFYSAFCKPGNYFKCSTDNGPVHKRDIWSTIVTKEINRIMKRSTKYFEKQRSTFASDVLHGIGPSAWRNQDSWRPDPLAIGDVLIPADTLLDMEDLWFFAIHRSFTVRELKQLTRNAPAKSKSYRGWNMPLVESCIEWIDTQMVPLMNSQYPVLWNPEKQQERIKGSGGIYVGDAVPKIECYDFYFWNDDENAEGWNRRMILDAWQTPADPSGALTRKSGELWNRDKIQFLYDSGKRKFASKLEELITFQFADLSAVAPFRYHTVRSLGFLLFSLCHVQNRLRCKVMEAIFENLNMLFKVKSQEDYQRAMKLDLVNRGFIDDSLEFVPAADRHQINGVLVELGLAQNQQLIEANSSSYTQNRQAMTDRREKTATQVMAELNAMTSLVSAALMQAYKYQEAEDREIFRRFCRRNSTDPEVRDFQARCVSQGVPLKSLVPNLWEVEHDKIMGAGNKMLEMAIAQQLMELYEKLDPEPQRQVLRKVILSSTDDAALALDLVPESPVKITDSVHDAQLAAGTLMQGLPVTPKTGMNHIEYVETLLASLALKVKTGAESGAITPEYLQGLQNIAQHIAEHIAIIAQDEGEKARVKMYGDQLNKLMNLVKMMAANLQKQLASQNGANGVDPETLAKAQATIIQAQTKSKVTAQSHAQRTVQRQIQFEQKLAQDQKKAALDLETKAAESTLDLQREHLKHRMNEKSDEANSVDVD